MDQQLFLEYFGYAASVVVAVSLMMKNIRRLRWLNLIGAGTFSLYGGLIGAWPVCVLNGFIAIVDVVYLIQMNRHKEIFDVMTVNPHESDYVRQFIRFYQNDIQTFFPDFELKKDLDYKAVFCLRDVRPVSLFLLTQKDEKTYNIELDYAIPEYRDNRTGRYLYYEGLRKLSLDKGGKFVAETRNPQHETYLKALGFSFRDRKDDLAAYTMTID